MNKSFFEKGNFKDSDEHDFDDDDDFLDEIFEEKEEME